MLLDGQDIWADKKLTRQARFRVGLVFQYPEYQLFEETVYKDIAFGPKNMGLSEEEIDRRVREAAGVRGAYGRSMLEKSPFELSGGQKRRVAIAGVIAMEPEVLILDEPTAGLDPAGRAEISGQHPGLPQGEERHDHAGLPLAWRTWPGLTDRLLVMNDAELAMDGTPREVFAHGRGADRHRDWTSPR